MRIVRKIPASTRAMLVAAVTGVAVLSSGGAAQAIEFDAYGVEAIAHDGTPARQAGSHPNLRVLFKTPLVEPGNLASSPVEQPHRFQLDLPVGVVGDPGVGPKCPESGMKAGDGGNNAVCPVGSQVGFARVFGGDQGEFNLPVFNVERPDDAPALFAFNVLGVVVKLKPTVRAGDYGISVDSGVIASAAQISGADVTLWGVPADPANDALRVPSGGKFLCFSPGFCFLFDGNGNLVSSPGDPHPLASQSERKPLLTLPTSCPGTADTVTARLDGWRTVANFTSRSVSADVNDVPLVNTGCQRLAFAPSVASTPTSRATDAPSGLDVDLRVPQSDSPDGLATAHVKDVTMVLPDGMSVSPSSARGLGGCSPAQIALETTAAPTCPRSSKLGTVTVETPLLEEPLTGDVILATPDQNPFGSLVALYIVAEGSGVRVKLPGRVDMNPTTGQLTATFKSNPQLPFSALKVRFDGGDNGSLATPSACGRYEAKTTGTSWSGKSVDLTSSMVIDQSCEPRGFAPGLSAGSTVPAAGKDTAFAMTIQRPERQQNLAGVAVQMPPGLLAKLKDVALCPEADAAAGSCSAASRIGVTQVLSGPGAAPLAVRGQVYLTGPYKGAPYGLSIVVPTAGQAGPFDLGVVVVRAAIHIDRTTAAVTVKSDPVPLILRGIPLQVRQVKVLIDRPGFMKNPTSCNATSITAAIDSAAAGANGMPLVDGVNAIGAGFAKSVGTTATPAAPFQVGGCRDLDFTPKLAMALTGKGQTTDGKHPGLTAKLTQLDGGQANNKKASVALPLSLALDPDNANGLCEPADAAADKCPAQSIVGRAHAISPILNEPLDGPVYFVRGERKDPKSGRTIRTLPKLYVPLTGEHGIKVDLHAGSEVKDERLVTTFDNIPDAPVTDFTLSITGGKHGILVVSNTNVCKANQLADSLMDGQNGAELPSVVSMTTPCSLAVVKSSHTATTLNVTVGGLGTGRVTVSGKGLSRKSRSLGESMVATVGVPMTKKTRTALARGRNVKVTVAVKFLSKGSKKAKTVKKTLTIHGAKKKS
jgi:hypothetical protein